ncbi:TerC family protein [Pollutimonas harenae]|uniref:TerC family protein n=1 Tax=Pollutimonas harenae TaxID=657015 RepID=A0A853H068_9BURK|nr:TerC family protein [Pollutimonas harenae]NYT86376.1 TerC family protein [Pollutimonas harenae]TEA69867.1 TerC family protein [Pollutimonas harenae]
MELLLDPSVWVGLLTLVVLEIVLGIDNLIFIAILADKLPPSQRDRARVIGLSLALVMRLALLSGISWLFKLTSPLFWVGSLDFSGRDLILILGGFFLVFKGTMEMHERVEGKTHTMSGSRMYPSFWVIVTQIVVLDAVFSLDAVITAVGMVDHLPVMMAAVIIAIGIMLVASKPLTRFVSAHPTVVILCLGFLLMIGFALIAEGFGFKVPKGYLYAAIGFSVAIEALNQIARRNLRNSDTQRPMRERTAEGILRMLGKRPAATDEATDTALDTPDNVPFAVEERNMVSGVLRLADRNVHSIMTPRNDITWLNLDDDPEQIRQEISGTPHGFFPVCRGSLDNIVGIGRAKDMITDLIQHGTLNQNTLRPPIIVHEAVRILDLIETLKAARGQLVIVINEFGAVEGLVTPIDVFEAIAGDFPDEDETRDIIPAGDDKWIVDGGTDLHHFEQTLEIEGLLDDEDEYSTLAGYMLSRFGRLPEVGDKLRFRHGDHEFRFKVLELEGRRIAKVQVRRRTTDSDQQADDAEADAA